MDIGQIIKKIQNTNDCIIEKAECKTIKSIDKFQLPNDLSFYFSNYKKIIFFEHSNYPITIVNFENFEKANPIIVGEDAEDDITNDWYIIGIGDNSQYITIDLNPQRLGRCYDSFWDRHGVVGENPILAHTFTDLLMSLLNSKGTNYFWLEDDFKSLGDAYDGIDI